MEVIMEIKEYLTHVNYRKGKNKKNLYLVIHYTANDGDTALNNCNYFNKSYRGDSANYFVDENSIYRCVKDEDVAWHVGAHKYYNDCRNDNSIGIELCSRKDKNGKYYFKEQTIENAVWLTAELAKKYNIDVDHNIFRHYDVTHKRCPAPFVDNYSAWVDFIDRVDMKLKEDEEDMVRYETIDEVPAWGKESVKKALDTGILKGTGKGLGLTETELKVLVWMDRAKCLDF